MLPCDHGNILPMQAEIPMMQDTTGVPYFWRYQQGAAVLLILAVIIVDFYILIFFCNSSPWTSATTLWDLCKYWKYVSKWSYYRYKSSFLVSEHNVVISLSPFLIVIFWSYFVIPSHDLTLIFNFFITIYPKIISSWQLIYLSLNIQREQIFGDW